MNFVACGAFRKTQNVVDRDVCMYCGTFSKMFSPEYSRINVLSQRFQYSTGLQ